LPEAGELGKKRTVTGKGWVRTHGCYQRGGKTVTGQDMLEITVFEKGSDKEVIDKPPNRKPGNL